MPAEAVEVGYLHWVVVLGGETLADYKEGDEGAASLLYAILMQYETRYKDHEREVQLEGSGEGKVNVED